MTVFDVKIQIENYFKVCKSVKARVKFAKVKEIKVDSIIKAFENLEYTHDRREVFYRFIYTGPKIWNSCTCKHKMPVTSNDWSEIFQTFEGDFE